LRPSTRLAGPGRGRHVVQMAAKDNRQNREREERLAAALRENLRRRKAQARKLDEEAPENR